MWDFSREKLKFCIDNPVQAVVLNLSNSENFMKKDSFLGKNGILHFITWRVMEISHLGEHVKFLGRVMLIDQSNLENVQTFKFSEIFGKNIEIFSKIVHVEMDTIKEGEDVHPEAEITLKPLQILTYIFTVNL